MMSMRLKCKDYNRIYQLQCVNCIREGTYHCKLVVSSDECVNFEEITKDNAHLFFGGY